MKKTHISLLAFAIFLALSCTPKNEEKPLFSTQIQYDVVLKKSRYNPGFPSSLYG